MSDSPLSVRWPNRFRTKASGKKSSSRQKGSSHTKLGLDDAILQALSETETNLRPAHQPAVWQGCCLVAVNGVELLADPEGVVYWPAEDTLLVADLHLEKGSSFAKRGQLIPPYDTRSTLKRLSASLEKWQPARVMALGDSFHDKEASERLDDHAKSNLAELAKGRDWVWITGNHDPDPPKDLAGDVVDELTLGNITLRHEPQPAPQKGEIAGHLHPKARLIRKARSIRRSCFATDKSRMILPAFGAYTGGLNVLDKAFEGLFEGRNFSALMRGEGQVYKIDGRELG